MRGVLELLGLTEEDLKSYTYKKRRYRSFLKNYKKIKRDVTFYKRSGDTAKNYYNICYGWNSKDLHVYYYDIEGVKARKQFRENIIRVEGSTGAQGRGVAFPIYVDAREMLGVLSEMGYDIKPNAKYYKSFRPLDGVKKIEGDDKFEEGYKEFKKTSRKIKEGIKKSKNKKKSKEENKKLNQEGNIGISL